VCQESRGIKLTPYKASNKRCFFLFAASPDAAVLSLPCGGHPLPFQDAHALHQRSILSRTHNLSFFWGFWISFSFRHRLFWSVSCVCDSRFISACLTCEFTVSPSFFCFGTLYFSCVFSGKYGLSSCVCVCAYFAESFPSVYHTHTHTHTTAQQLTIILMPICLIVGFLIPKAPSSFQQGLTVLARDGLPVCVCVLVCEVSFLEASCGSERSFAHPPLPQLYFNLNTSAGQSTDMNHDRSELS